MLSGLSKRREKPAGQAARVYLHGMARPVR